LVSLKNDLRSPYIDSTDGKNERIARTPQLTITSRFKDVNSFKKAEGRRKAIKINNARAKKGSVHSVSHLKKLRQILSCLQTCAHNPCKHIYAAGKSRCDEYSLLLHKLSLCCFFFTVWEPAHSKL